MLQGYDPVTQALLGTLFTWGLTAAGAALVFVFTSGKVRNLLGCSPTCQHLCEVGLDYSILK